MKIVVISGKQGSGKTTLSEGLGKRAEAANMVVSRIKFADPLYAMQGAIHRVLSAYGEEFKIPDGKLLQLLGTEWGRTVLGHDVWSRILMRRVSTLYDLFEKDRLIIIDDCRFKNELEACNALRAERGCHVLTVRLEAEQEARHGRAEKWRENTQHPSEIDLDGEKFDLELNTTASTPEETLQLVCSALEAKNDGRE